MTAQTLILPYNRASLHIPRRDLVLSAADSLGLRVTIVESDDPSALALDLTGGIGGPTCLLLIYPGDWHWGRWDYGAPRVSPGTVLWAGLGVIDDAIGSFDIEFPPGTMAQWPRRCAWSIMLDWDGGGHAELIAEGYLHVRPTGQRLVPPVTLDTDTDVPILVDGS